MIECINLRLREWQMDQTMSLQAMWKLPGPRFKVKMADLADGMHWEFNSVQGNAYFTVNGRRLQNSFPKGNGCTESRTALRDGGIWLGVFVTLTFSRHPGAKQRGNGFII